MHFIIHLIPANEFAMNERPVKLMLQKDNSELQIKDYNYCEMWLRYLGHEDQG
jgi:hypothetical protein